MMSRGEGRGEDRVEDGGLSSDNGRRHGTPRRPGGSQFGLARSISDLGMGMGGNWGWGLSVDNEGQLGAIRSMSDLSRGRNSAGTLPLLVRGGSELGADRPSSRSCSRADAQKIRGGATEALGIDISRARSRSRDGGLSLDDECELITTQPISDGDGSQNGGQSLDGARQIGRTWAGSDLSKGQGRGGGQSLDGKRQLGFTRPTSRRSNRADAGRMSEPIAQMPTLERRGETLSSKQPCTLCPTNLRIKDLIPA
jgi:hypothetical protein